MTAGVIDFTVTLPLNMYPLIFSFYMYIYDRLQNTWQLTYIYWKYRTFKNNTTVIK